MKRSDAFEIDTCNMTRTRTIEVIALLIAIITVIVTIANPEIRSYIGLEPAAESTGESIGDGGSEIGNWFHDDILYRFNETYEACNINNECDCCGGDFAFRKDGRVIFVFSCVGNPIAYRIGSYEMIGDSIHCRMKDQCVEVTYDHYSDDVSVATVRKDSFELWVAKSNCSDYPYGVNLGEEEPYEVFLYRFSGWEYKDFVQRMKEKRVYDKLLQL